MSNEFQQSLVSVPVGKYLFKEDGAKTQKAEEAAEEEQ